MCIRTDVRGVKKLDVVKAAHRTAVAVGEEDTLAERQLVEALAGQAGDVAPSSVVDHVDREIRSQRLWIVHRDSEGQRVRIVANDEDRPLRPVPARRRPEQIHEGKLAVHRPSKSHVVPVKRVRSPVAVPQEPIGANLVLVRTIAAFQDRNRGDAQWGIGHCCRFEDALWPHQRHPLAINAEPLSEQVEGENPPTLVSLHGEPLERGQPHKAVTASGIHGEVLHDGSSRTGSTDQPPSLGSGQQRDILRWLVVPNDLARREERLNDRPRRTLGWLSPSEKLVEVLR